MVSLRPADESDQRKALGDGGRPCDSVDEPLEPVMDVARQNREVDRNYDIFVRLLASLLPEHRDEYALMRDGEILGFFAKPGEANRAGVERFADGVFSIQEVTDEPIDLGFWSHVASH